MFVAAEKGDKETMKRMISLGADNYNYAMITLLRKRKENDCTLDA
jgi:hypothetical protein